MKERYYYDGIFYETQEELFKAARDFSNSHVSEASLERLVSLWKKDILLNIQWKLSERGVTNSEMNEILSLAFTEIMKQFDKLTENDKPRDS